MRNLLITKKELEIIKAKGYTLDISPEVEAIKFYGDKIFVAIDNKPVELERNTDLYKACEMALDARIELNGKKFGTR